MRANSRVRFHRSGLLTVGLAAGLAVCAPGTPPQSFPSRPPPLGEPVAFNLPQPATRELANGLRVLYLPRPGLPLVHATLVTRGGRTDAPPDAPELSDFVADMMSQGAGGRGALELADEIAAIGASLSVNEDWDEIRVDLNVLRDRLPDGLGLMADVVARPDFPVAEITRVREQRLAALLRVRDNPSELANRAFARLAFGETHPYARPFTTRVTGSITSERLGAHHGAFVRPNVSILIVAGDVVVDDVHPLVEASFGDWLAAEVPEPLVPRGDPPPSTSVYVVDRPGAPQSQIWIGHPGLPREHPDYVPLQVMNTVLGGYFPSRLNLNLREDKGFTYGAFSRFIMRRGTGSFILSAGVVTESTAPAIAEFLAELDRIRSEPVAADELEQAKNYLVLSLPTRFQTTSGLANAIGDLVLYDVEPTAYERYTPDIMAVTADDVRRVAREHLDPGRLAVLIVGDLAAVEDPVRALDLGPFETRLIDEFVR